MADAPGPGAEPAQSRLGLAGDEKVGEHVAGPEQRELTPSAGLQPTGTFRVLHCQLSFSLPTPHNYGLVWKTSEVASFLEMITDVERIG